ncbi:ATPase [Micromonospora sp. ATCC 39149]|nr:ATPase [Micromonospora sp. ATCC 39149]
MQGFAALAARLAENVNSVVLGKPQVVRLALTALFAQGHVLLEDVPGVGKTTLARAIAATVKGRWRRIQFTPDLLPSDVSGVTIFNQATRGFEFHPGPVFANIVIADEINRASPKTQSALLEVMEERTVTVDGVRHPVPQPFLVVATQNPVEMDGTYRLPGGAARPVPGEAVRRVSRRGGSRWMCLRGATVRSPRGAAGDRRHRTRSVRWCGCPGGCTSPSRCTRTRSRWPPRPVVTRRCGWG